MLSTDLRESLQRVTRRHRAACRCAAIVRVAMVAWIMLRVVFYAPVGFAAERSARYLVIHADDAGMSHSVNQATAEALEYGLVTSASIMVPCGWFVEFAEYAKEHPQFDYGIHLTLNCEWKKYRWGPVAPRERVPSLVDPDGYMWRSVDFTVQHAKASEVEIELRAQIDRAKKFGVPLTHVDTHMGALVSRPDLLEVYVKVGLDYNLPMLFLRELGAPIAEEYPVLAKHGPRLIKQLDERKFPVLDRMGQFYGGEDHEERRQTYRNYLRELQPGINQLIIHCGFDNDELRAITSSSPRRDGDRRIFTAPEMKQEIRELGIELVDWRQLRKIVESPAGGK